MDHNIYIKGESSFFAKTIRCSLSSLGTTQCFCAFSFVQERNARLCFYCLYYCSHITPPSSHYYLLNRSNIKGAPAGQSIAPYGPR